MDTAVTSGPQDGAWIFGDFSVSWRGERTPSGWQVQALLQLGAASMPLQLAGVVERRSFDLYDAQQMAWGHLDLHPDDSGRWLVLRIACHCGLVTDRPVPLCAWQACDPCGSTPPVSGRATLGPDGWVTAAWTVAGADEGCLVLHLSLSAVGEERTLAVATLDPQHPEWQTNLRRGDVRTNLRFTLGVAGDGTAHLHASVRQAEVSKEEAELSRFDLALPLPAPPAKPSTARELACFTYPRGLQAPTAVQCLRRFVPLANAGPFQQALGQLAGAAQRAEALDFLAAESLRYPGQCVRRIEALPGPMGRLAGPAVPALLAMWAGSVRSVQEAAERLLDTSAEQFVAQPDHALLRARLQDSVTAWLIAGTPSDAPGLALLQALQVCHVAQWLAGPDAPLATAEEAGEALQASVLLPAAIWPPLAGLGMQPLGFADVQVIQQRLLRYRLGSIAHVENVMRGESRRSSEQHSRRVEGCNSERGEQHETEQRRYEGIAHQPGRQATILHPLTSLRREFHDLAQTYAPDGLSVAWTETPSGQTHLQGSAAAHARHLLEQAALRVTRRVELQRRQHTVDEFVARRQRRFDNEGGVAHLVGVYRWIDEIHAVHLECRGSRLILEVSLADPAADHVRRSNAWRELDVQAPVPPWRGGHGIEPVHSPADITRTNHAALAARYHAAIESPPSETLNLSATLTSDSPQHQVCVEIPAGYGVDIASLGYGWVASNPSTATPALTVLVGAAALKIDLAQDPNPGTRTLTPLSASGDVVMVAMASGLEYVLQLSLSCTCAAEADVYLRWQRAAYACVQAAYLQRRDEYLQAMAQAAGAQAPAAARDELEKSALDALMAPWLARSQAHAAADPRTAALVLAPFFRHALEWTEMTYRFYGRAAPSGPASPDPLPDSVWLGLAQRCDGAPDWREFLLGGAARVWVPVVPAQVLPLLHYLASGGQFWPGPPDQAPVHAADVSRVNEWKSLRQVSLPPAPGVTWEVEVATHLLMLQPDAQLPSPGEASTLPPIPPC